MDNEKELTEQLRDHLQEIKDPYPGFVSGIMGLMGYLTDEQFSEFVRWTGTENDLSTDDITERALKYLNENKTTAMI